MCKIKHNNINIQVFYKNNVYFLAVKIKRNALVD
jgi:hypothetical protein